MESFAMAQILVRDLDQAVVDRLKERARQNNRSLQGEVKALLESVSAVAKASPDELKAIAEKWDRHWGDRMFDDSSALIREDRDSR
jgi:plasmid stability protein